MYEKIIGADGEHRMLMSYDLGDWVTDHLAHFVVDVVDKLDMRGVYGKYQGVGSQKGLMLRKDRLSKILNKGHQSVAKMAIR